MQLLLILGAPLFLLPCAYLLWLVILYRRPPVTGTSIVPEYGPSANIGPAEAAYLIDGTFKPRAIAAMLVDLHLRGVIELTDTGTGNSVLTLRSGVSSSLASYERLSLALIFGSDRTIDAKEAGARFEEGAKHVQAAIIASLKQKKILAERDLLAPILLGASCVAAVILWLGMMPVFGFFGATGVAASLVIMTQFMYIAATWRPALTPSGRQALLVLLGFRMFLGAALVDRIVWEEKELGEFDKYLPYAIVFDVTLTWATRLQNVTDALLINIL